MPNMRADSRLIIIRECFAIGHGWFFSFGFRPGVARDDAGIGG